MYHCRIIGVKKSFANFFVREIIAPQNAGHLHHGMQVSIRYKWLLFHQRWSCLLLWMFVYDKPSTWSFTQNPPLLDLSSRSYKLDSYLKKFWFWKKCIFDLSSLKLQVIWILTQHLPVISNPTLSENIIDCKVSLF